MGNNTAITVRLPRELGEKLQMLARGLNRAPSDLAVEAVASYVDLNFRQVQEIERGRARSRPCDALWKLSGGRSLLMASSERGFTSHKTTRVRRSVSEREFLGPPGIWQPSRRWVGG